MFLCEMRHAFGLRPFVWATANDGALEMTIILSEGDGWMDYPFGG